MRFPGTEVYRLTATGPMAPRYRPDGVALSP